MRPRAALILALSSALVAAAVGCDATPDDKTADAGTAGHTDWSLYDDTAADPGADDTEDHPATDGSTDDPSGDPWGRDLACPQPTACISLAEAVDRGFAHVVLSGTLDVVNDGPYPICAGRWHTFFSDTSQDAIAGHTDITWPGEPEDALEIDDDDIWGHQYARTAGGPAWWCIERTQLTADGSTYRFTGARAPEPLLRYVHTDTDTNGNGTEDHVDYADPTTGAPWTNHNIWDHLAANPTYVVGRTPNYLELRPGTSAPLTIEVVNLGREAGNIRVTERLPAGARGYGFTVTPTTSETHGDGSTTHTWYFKMSGAEDDDDLSEPATYDTVQIDYQVTWERPDCGTRERTWAPEVTWTDTTGSTYTSLGTELVLACCADG